MTRRWRPAVVALVALAAGCAGDAGAPAPPPERQVLIVSGRDDHGLLADPLVGLHREPDGPLADRVPDGTLVAVVETDGEWIHVRALEGDPAEGWVNDFYLRGTAVLECTNEQVELLAVDGGRVQVQPAGGGPARWVDRHAVGELPTECSPDHEHGDGAGGAGDGHDHDHGGGVGQAP